MRAIIGDQNNFVRFRNDFGLCVFQIETGSKLFACLIESVIDLLLVHFRDDIERRQCVKFRVSNFKFKLMSEKIARHGFASAILMSPLSTRISIFAEPRLFTISSIFISLPEEFAVNGTLLKSLAIFPCAARARR